MNKIIAIGLLACVCLLATSCSPATVTAINLVVSGAENALILAANESGTPVNPSLSNQIKTDGNLLISAYTDWNSAAPALKPGLWPKVQEALNIFQKDLPQILQAAHISDPAYLDISNFVISEIDSVAIAINGSQANVNMVSRSKGTAPILDAKTFKAEYNAKMKANGHPDLKI